MLAKSPCRSAIPASILVLCLTLAGAVFAQSDSHIVTLTGLVSCSMCVLPNACKAPDSNVLRLVVG
jgi:hypothetical protein